VLGRFLRALGVPASAVPVDEHERAELYRSLLAERRFLVVLDDARDEEQVMPLLPGTGTCGVIVTSRVRLGALSGPHRVELGEFPDTDGAVLLRKIAGDRMTAARPGDVRALLRLSAGLPLALRIAGSLLVARPHYQVADLIVQLDDARHRLDGLNYRGLELRASFALSYQGLRPGARRLFRLLGLLEVPDFSVWGAAAVLDTEPAIAQRLLDELVDVHLLDVVTTPQGQVRYLFHDLIRVYARERVENEDAADTRKKAMIRALERCSS
jgi:NB-ARC domain-containing protein